MDCEFTTAEIKKESTMNAGRRGKTSITPKPVKSTAEFKNESTMKASRSGKTAVPKAEESIYSDPRYQSGTLFDCESDDYPFIVRAGVNGTLYLFPDCLLYKLDELFIIRKTSKVTKKRPLKIGERIWFRADCRRIVEDFALLDDNVVQNVYECVGVFSPDRLHCWTRLYGILPLRVPVMAIVPNIAYTINVNVVGYYEEGPDDAIPTPRLTYQLQRVVDVVYKEVTFEPYHRSIYSAPWNSSRERIPYCCPTTSQDYYDQPDDPVLPKPPIPYTGDKSALWLLQNQEVLWSGNPKFRAVLAMPRSSTVLEPGTALEGRMFYCEFDKIYVVFRHRAMRSKKIKTADNKAAIIKLPCRHITENGQETDYYEYQVKLQPSEFKGFFVCSRTGHTLFEDKKNLFLKANLESTESNPIVAWVTPNEQDRVARFTVTALDEQPDNTCVAAPIINGTGFQANNRTGSVFSETHPAKRIFLTIPDRLKMQTGEYFQFAAVYHETMNAFMIIWITPMKTRTVLKATPYGDSFLFEDTIYCKEMWASHRLYRSKNFILVTDSEDIILNKSKKENEDLPDEISVCVTENTDSNRSIFFNVFGLSKPSEKELALNEPSMSPSMRTFAQPWWKSKNSCGKCKHPKATELSDEILAQITENEIGDERKEFSKLIRELRNL